eukprot:GHVO01069166.1.p1 GENE.GHVO01069166.1~~GHVO01069166.1.p1  ORF type:complete len:143 (+),score=9.02 GHVO01069166.1:499-927(+)
MHVRYGRAYKGSTNVRVCIVPKYKLTVAKIAPNNLISSPQKTIMNERANEDLYQPRIPAALMIGCNGLNAQSSRFGGAADMMDIMPVLYMEAHQAQFSLQACKRLVQERVKTLKRLLSFATDSTRSFFNKPPTHMMTIESSV